MRAVTAYSKEAVLPKFSDFIFPALICLLLLTPIALAFSQTIFRLPVSNITQNSESIYLEGTSSLSAAPAFTIENFTNGAFQSFAEDRISSYIPYKSSIILTNALLQRKSIELSSSVFSYPCYPTNFSSDILYLPKQKALMRSPEPAENATLESAQIFTRGLCGVAKSHHDIKFHVFIADMSEYSGCNPGRALVSSATATTSDFTEAVESAISVNNVSVLSCPPESTDEYFRYYYRTDHHWSGFGTIDAYNQIASIAGLTPFDGPIAANSELEGLVMNGSNARSGLLLLNETAHEPNLHLGRLLNEAHETAPVALADGRKILNLDPLRTEFDFYHDWYGPSAPALISNMATNSTESALLIGDSYTSSMQWLIASNYLSLEVRLDCHGGYNGIERLTDLIECSNCSDVFFVLAPTGFGNLLSCYPNYFSL